MCRTGPSPAYDPEAAAVPVPGMSNTTFDVPDAAPAVHVMDVGLTRPPLALHLPVPLPDPSTALVQLAANGAFLAMSLPDVTVTTGFPVVPVEQLSWALIDMTVEAGVPALSRGLNLTFPVAWHCNVPVALNRGVALASAPISNDAMRVSAVTVGRINAKCFLRTSCLRGPCYQDGRCLWTPRALCSQNPDPSELVADPTAATRTMLRAIRRRAGQPSRGALSTIRVLSKSPNDSVT
jgi:hypothetical protein